MRHRSGHLDAGGQVALRRELPLPRLLMPPASRAPWATGRGIAGSAGWNVLGQILPLLTALVALPVLTEALGADRLGILALAWALVGYFTVFDLGLGRAATRELAPVLADGRRREVAPVAWTALWGVIALGVIAGLVLAALVPLLVGTVLNVSPGLEAETTTAFYFVAAALPFVVPTTALRGVLEAQGRFGLVNALRIPTGVATYCSANPSQAVSAVRSFARCGFGVTI